MTRIAPVGFSAFVAETVPGALTVRLTRSRVVGRAFLLVQGFGFLNRSAFNNDYNFTKSCQAASDWIGDAKRCAAGECRSLSSRRSAERRRRSNQGTRGMLC